MRVNSLKKILCIVSVSFILVSCNSKNIEITSSPIPTNTPIDAPEIQLPKAAFLYWDNEEDNIALSAHKDAVIYLESLGYDCVSVNISKDDSAADIFVDMDDVDISFLTSYSMQDIADEYYVLNMGDMKFCLYNMYWPQDHVKSYNLNSYEAYYLFGIALAAVSETNIAGFLASYSDTSTMQCINALALGMKSYDADSKVVIRWTNLENKEGFTQDMDVFKEMGCDVIAHKQLGNNVNVAANGAGLFYISDMINDSIIDDSYFIDAQLITLGVYFDEVLKDILNEQFTENDVDFLGLGQGIISISNNNSIVSDEVKEIIDGKISSIEDGSFIVFSGPIYDAYGQLIVPEGMQMDIEDLAGMMWFVDNVIGDVPAG